MKLFVEGIITRVVLNVSLFFPVSVSLSDCILFISLGQHTPVSPLLLHLLRPLSRCYPSLVPRRPGDKQTSEIQFV